jgi:hypothetical protein
MNRRMFGVVTIERQRHSREDFDPATKQNRTFIEYRKELRKTYCESPEEAGEFIREIKRRQHPNVLEYWTFPQAVAMPF